jgi:hypothetical protein
MVVCTTDFRRHWPAICLSVEGKLMKRITVYRFTAAVVAVCFAWTIGSAQSEKVALRMIPQPNHVVRTRTVQETEVDMSFESSSPVPALMPPMKLATKIVMGITQKSGSANAQGIIETELTYEEFRFETTVNGQPTPSNDVSRDFVGKSVTVMFDKTGDVVDIKVPSDIGIPEDSFRQILKSMYGNLPAVSIGVGESATVPLDFTLPIPLPGAAPLKMDGDVKHTLVSIDSDATGRVARFDHSISGKMITDLEMPVPTGKVKMSLDFNINGGGSMVRDLDKGVLRSSETKSTFDGKIKIAGEPNTAPLPSMDLHGTTKTITTSGN